MAKESSFKNMVITLTVITLIASGVLGGVYALTKDTIDLGVVKKINDAIAEVVPEFDNNPSAEKITKEIDGGEVVLYPATKDGKSVGAAVETFTKNGFSGEIKLMVGFLPTGQIKSIAVISHNETPGLGDKIEKKKSNFSAQFENKDPRTAKLIVKNDGGEVDAITASTISSRAYCEAIDRAFKVFSDQMLGASWEGSTGASAEAEATKTEDAATGASTEQDNTDNK